MGYKIQLLLITILVFICSNAFARIPKKTKALSSCSAFVSHQEIGDLLEDYADDYPEVARFFSIGTSVEGRELWALRISANPDEESFEPEIRIIGTIHGDECISASLVLELIDWLLTNHGDDDLASDLVDGTEILFVPLVNPDGYSSGNAKRVNANGIDLNRNLGFGWLDEGDAPFSEPETTALRDISQQNSFMLGLTYHTVAAYINSAWNYKPHHPRDEDLFNAIGEDYAGDSNYNVTFGWDWYVTNGDVNDWSLGTEGTLDWTIEMRNDNDMQFQTHLEGAKSFMSYAFHGAEGLVTDAQTGKPLAARITMDPAGEPNFSDPDIGDYHQAALPGTYDITAIANGYRPLTIEDVEITRTGTTIVDFQLERNNEVTAFAINEMTMPKQLSIAYKFMEYKNYTKVSDALGPKDELFYSMSPGGSVTVDMGLAIEDKPGSDFIIVSGTDSEDPIIISIADDQDGPFYEVAEGVGDIEIDIAQSELDEARFIKIEDQGNGPFNAPYAGYDLDAIIALQPKIDDEKDTDIDTEKDTDNTLDSDTRESSDSQTNDEYDDDGSMATAGCGCHTSAAKHQSLIYSLILLL